MEYEIQKAPILKRFAAFIVDLLLKGILIVVLLTGLASVFGLQEYSDRMKAVYEKYADEYGISLDADFNALSPEEQEKYNKANEALAADEEAVSLYRSLMIRYTAAISLSILIVYLLLEFAVPLLFKEGRTVGKKLFGLCVIHTNCVRMEMGALLVRAVVGKYVIETMIPVLSLFMLRMGIYNAAGLMITAVLGVIQLVLFFAGKNRRLIHDYLAQSAVADFQSQPVFASADELQEEKGRITERAAHWSK